MFTVPPSDHCGTKKEKGNLNSFLRNFEVEKPVFSIYKLGYKKGCSISFDSASITDPSTNLPAKTYIPYLL